MRNSNYSNLVNQNVYYFIRILYGNIVDLDYWSEEGICIMSVE